jgi:preprotein translocase subunit SecA
MDYLQEGINLRAMGQKDPLVEWQREGFELFGQLMKGIANDFVRYILHVKVVQNEQTPAPAAAIQNVQTSAPDLSSSGFATAAAAGQDVAEIEDVPPPAPSAAPSTKQQTVVNDEWAKTPRNAPCPCGSGKKFKLCHGAS